MFKKKVYLFLFITLISNYTFANSASDLNRADLYIKSGQFNQVQQLCTLIAQSDTDKNASLAAKGKLIASDIASQKISEADSAVNQLITDFNDSPKLPEVLYGILLRYKSAREFQKAQNLSNIICQQFPSSEQAQRIQFDIGKEQVLNLISKGKYQEAEDGTNQFISVASDTNAVSATLYRIAKEFKVYEAFDSADRVYQKIAQNYPNSQFGSKAKMAVDKLKVWALIKKGDIAGVDSATNKLINDYKNNEDLAHTIHGFGIQFEKARNFAKAKSIYQKVANDFPDNWVAEIAAIDLEMCDVRAMIDKSSFSDVMSQLNAVRNKFSGNWHLPKAIRQVGQEYQRQAEKLEKNGNSDEAKEFYKNAISVWDIIINQLPKSSATSPAICWTADCYYKLNEHQKAKTQYQKLINDYPNYRFGDYVLFMTAAQCDRNLQQTGKISESQAINNIKTIYQQLVEKYPDTSAAESAKKWLDRNSK